MLYYVKAFLLWNLTMFSLKKVQRAMHRWFAWGATIIFFKFCLVAGTRKLPRFPHLCSGAMCGHCCGILC